MAKDNIFIEKLQMFLHIKVSTLLRQNVSILVFYFNESSKAEFPYNVCYHWHLLYLFDFFLTIKEYHIEISLMESTNMHVGEINLGKVKFFLALIYYK